MKKKICFIAQFPPPIHGLSNAVDTLYRSKISNEFELEKINITKNSKFLTNLLKISKSKADLFYFTLSQTKNGNIRDLIILKLLKIQKKKCLIHLHGGYYRQLVDNDLPVWQKKENYNEIGKVAGAIVLGPSLKYIFQGMLADEKIFIVPNCVDDEYIMPAEEFEEKVNTLKERKIKHILYLSNFIKSKGYPEVLNLARLEKEKVDAGGEHKFYFDFAGNFLDKAEKNFFWKYVNDNGIEDYITYHGVVSGDKKRELLKICDVFILLTRYPKEGQPISILEAMGNGMVVITTNHAGIIDVVETELNEIVEIGNNSFENIFVMLQTLYDNKIETIERINRDKVEQKYMQSEYVNKMQNCFNICLKSN